MNLFTVTIEFEDRTLGIEQISASDEKEALENALQNAEALKKCNQNKIKNMVHSHIKIVHQANALKGVWTWHKFDLEDIDTNDIFGGIIIQTDSNGPLRNKLS